MEDFKLESDPFYRNDSVQVRIYNAFCSSTRQSVVVKCYECAGPEEINNRLMEAVTMAKLDHPNICRLYKPVFEIINKRFFVNIVMEKLESDVKKEVEAREQPYSESALLEFLKVICSALEYAHSKKIAHRDLKPDNVFVASDGNYKLGDFSAFWEQKTAGVTKGAAGAPLYISPQGRRIMMGDENIETDPTKGDVYSLGATLLAMAKRAEPYNLNTLDNLEARIEQEVSSLQYSDRLKSILRSMLTVDEVNRPTMKEVLSVLQPEQTAELILPASPVSGVEVRTFQIDNGDYKGYCNASGQRDGYGRQVWRSGDSYEGYWKDDKFNGKGTFRSVNGERYDGEFVQNEKQGIGKWKTTLAKVLYARSGCPNHEVVFIGEFQRNKPQGIGAIFNEQQHPLVVGSFYDGKIMGKAFECTDGEALYYGVFGDNGEKTGFGIEVNESEVFYKGKFRHGKYHGAGTIYLPESFFKGKWANGQRNGKGVLKTNASEARWCEFSNDQFVKWLS